MYRVKTNQPCHTNDRTTRVKLIHYGNIFNTLSIPSSMTCARQVEPLRVLGVEHACIHISGF